MYSATRAGLRGEGSRFVRGLLLPAIAFVITLIGLSAVAVIGGTGRAAGVLVLYVAATSATLVLARGSVGIAFATGIAAGVVVLGVVSFGVALLPGIALWVIAWRAAARAPGKQQSLAAIEGVVVGLWVVLLPVLMSR